ncbi:hypothetical protein HK405_007453 [Cladochytrium tenue]|nr:hypothetical protein HK405_007453 [Cladochytrium tenue]
MTTTTTVVVVAATPTDVTDARASLLSSSPSAAASAPMVPWLPGLGRRSKTLLSDKHRAAAPEDTDLPLEELGFATSNATDSGVLASEDPPADAAVQLQQWNKPRINMWRCFAAFLNLLVLGVNDGSYGAVIPYMETFYGVDYTTVSLIFLSPICGYAISAAVLNSILHRFGQRGIALLTPLCHLAAYAVMCARPPFLALVAVYILAGLGSGLADGAWNAWIGGMAKANEVLGFLHAFYGLGAVIGPLVATSIASTGLPWYTFYYFMAALAAVELVCSLAAFWGADAAAFRASNAAGPADPPEPPAATANEAAPAVRRAKPMLWAALTHDRTAVLAAAFLLVYVGIEVSYGGWIVTFMLRERGGTSFSSGMVATGFWLGLTAGRVVLGFVTARLGEKAAVAAYMSAAAALQLLFWLVPSFGVGAASVALIGFFLGPIFPGTVAVVSRILPRRLHVTAIGFIAAFGSAGACVLPFGVGAAAQQHGVQVLQPIILAMEVLAVIVWLCLPKVPKRE